MVKILLSVLIALSPLNSYAAVGLPVDGKIEDATIFPGLLVPSNYVANPIAWPNKSLTNTALNATQDQDTSTNYKIDGKSSWKCTTTAQTGYCSVKLRVLPDQMKGGYCKAVLAIKGDASLHSIQVMQGSTVKFSQNIYKNYSEWDDFKSASFPCSSSYDGMRFTQTKAGTATQVNLGFGFGKAGDIVNVASSYSVGTITQVGASGCQYYENSSSGLNDFKPLLAGSGCSAWVSKGIISAIGNNDHRAVMTNGPYGDYRITIKALFYVGGVGNCVWRLSDGSNYYDNQSNYSGASGGSGVNALTYYVPNIGGTKTFTLDVADDTTATCGFNNDALGRQAQWEFTYLPTTSQLATNPNLPTQPTTTELLSGSGTFTVPAGATSLKIRMVGGGAGGGGGGSSGMGTGTSGTDSTFGGSSLLKAGGGNNGGGNYGAGGTSTIGTGATGFTYSGGNGGGPTIISGNGQYAGGAMGGSSIFGGAGSGTLNSAGSSAAANSGGGGGGGGANNTAGIYTGGGGGAGGGLEAIINNPASSYAYVVGAKGTGGAGGSNGYAGGDGGSGKIEITVYYQGMNAPVLLGGSLSDSPSRSLKHFTARVAGATSSTICSSNPCTLYDTTGDGFTGVTRSSTGTFVAGVKPGMCGAALRCALGIAVNNLDAISVFPLPTSLTSINLTVLKLSTEAVKDGYFDLMCSCLTP